MGNNKVLHIVRHAKSSWDYDGISDADRPLKLRGINDAYDMANRLKKRETPPDAIISSPANRALHTATIFCKVLYLPYENLKINPALYASSEDDILQVVKKTDNSYSSLMVFGHNPEMTYFAGIFLSNGFFEMPTCGMVTIKFKCDTWKEITKKNVTSEFIDYPKRAYS